MGFLDDLPDLGFGPPPRPAKRVTPPDVDCVSWKSVHCPQCGSGECPVIDSRQVPVRKHKCRACGHEFRSIEVNWQGGKPLDGQTVGPSD